jgi:hypothetical protein
MLFWGAGLSPSQRRTPEPRVHPELTTARSGPLADEAFRQQPEQRPNVDHKLLPIGGLVNVG